MSQGAVDVTGAAYTSGASPPMKCRCVELRFFAITRRSCERLFKIGLDISSIVIVAEDELGTCPPQPQQLATVIRRLLQHLGSMANYATESGQYALVRCHWLGLHHGQSVIIEFINSCCCCLHVMY